MASVRQLTTPNREGKRPWIVEYTDPSGKRRRATPKSGLKKDADKLRQKIEREIGDGTHTARSETVTMGEAVTAWLKDCDRRRKIKDRMAGMTLTTYEKNARLHVIPAFGKLLLTQVTPLAMQDFVNKLATTHKWRTVAGIAVILKQTFKFAIAREWISANPLLSRPLRIPGRRKTEKSIPSREEIRLILDAASERRKGEYLQSHIIRMTMVVLALFAGLRRGEVFGLQWENVDLDNRLLHVRHSLSYYDGLKGPKTEAGIRTIPMAEPVYAVLMQVRAHAGPEPKGFVLLNIRGRPVAPQDCWDFWRVIMQAAGLVNENGGPKYTFHSLRHANVSLLIAQGLDAFRIKGLIGHGSIAVTLDIYGHLFPDDGTGRKAIEGAASQFTHGREAPVLNVPNRASRARLLAPTRQERDIST